MQIGVIGATGTIGSRVVSEALGRGHHVTAFSRDASRIQDGRQNITWKSVDVTDTESVAAVLPGLDVLVNGFHPGNTANAPADAIGRAIADPAIYAKVATALLTALNSHPRTRLIVIGGAASLEAQPGVVFIDLPEIINQALDQWGLPREYAAAMRGHGEAMNVYRTSNRLWTYFSPALETEPGERTGRFRIGGDQPVMDANGRSHLSSEDAAVAVIDEAELPRFVQRRFTAGY
jgi:hypothetical protein